MALLAGFTGRTQIVHGRRNGPRVGIEHHGEYLANPAELRADVPAGARPDVASGAGNARVWRVLVGYELRMHDGMTDLSAELRRIGVMVAAVATDADQQNHDHRDEGEDHELFAMARCVQVEARVLRPIMDVRIKFPPPAPLEQPSEKHEHQPCNQECRENQKGPETRIWI